MAKSVASSLVCSQGSDTRVRTHKKNLAGFFGYTNLKNPPQKTHTSTLT